MRLDLTAVLAAGTLTSVAHPGEPVAFYLTVLHYNDAESQLVDAGSGSEDFGGAARFATLVDNLRAAAPSGGSLLISGGDNFLAGPEFNASLTSGVPFFDTLAMELIGYDVAAIGNHEFDFGPDVLADFLSGFSIGSGPTFVSANLDFTNEPSVQALVNSGRVASSTVITVDGTDIGIVGATTPNLPFISSPRDTIINDVATAVQAEIDALTISVVPNIPPRAAQGTPRERLLTRRSRDRRDRALRPDRRHAHRRRLQPDTPGHRRHGQHHPVRVARP